MCKPLINGGFMKFILSLVFTSLFSLTSFGLIQEGDIGACFLKKTILTSGSEVEKNSCATENSNGLVLLEFVSATCKFCIQTLPDVAAFSDEMKGSLTVRQVGVDKDINLLKKFWTEHQQYMVFDFALDNARDLKNAYRVQAVPSFVLIDSNHTVLFVNEGTLEEDQFNHIREIVKNHQY